jgi:transposase
MILGKEAGEYWAVVASLIETCKMNDVDPESYLRDVLTKIVARHPMSRIDELLPFAYLPAQAEKAAA